MHWFRIIALFVFASTSAGCSLEWGLRDGSIAGDGEPRPPKSAVCHGKEKGAEAKVQAEFPGFNLEELSAVRVVVHASSDPLGEWHPGDPDALSLDTTASTITFSCEESDEDVEVNFIITH